MPSCVALAPEGPGSLDVVELDAASHGGVDDTRELRDRAFYMPAESRYRVFIIDEAHMVSAAGFNALLKIVEEPPEHLVFIFATTEPEKVMTTIRSRTHHYPFRLIPPATLRKLLERLCSEEGVTVEAAVFPLVIRAGGGSARDSLSILDQLLAGAGPEGVTYRHAVALLGVTDAALLDETVDALAADDGASVFGAIDKVVEAGHDPRRFAADLLQRFRDLVILAAVPEAATKGLIDAPEDQLAAMLGQSVRLGAGTLTRLAELLHTGLTDMRGTTAPRLALELMCARMLLPAASGGEGALVQRVERLEQSMAAGTVPGHARGTSEGSAVRQPEPSKGLTAVPAVGVQAIAPGNVAAAGPGSGAAPASPVPSVAAPAGAAAGTVGPGDHPGPPAAGDLEPAPAAYRRPSMRTDGGRGAARPASPTPPTDAPIPSAAQPARPIQPVVNADLGLPSPPVLSTARRGTASGGAGSVRPPAEAATPVDDWLPPDAPPDEDEYGDPVSGSAPARDAQAPGLAGGSPAPSSGSGSQGPDAPAGSGDLASENGAPALPTSSAGSSRTAPTRPTKLQSTAGSSSTAVSPAEAPPAAGSSDSETAKPVPSTVALPTMRRRPLLCRRLRRRLLLCRRLLCRPLHRRLVTSRQPIRGTSRRRIRRPALRELRSRELGARVLPVTSG